MTQRVISARPSAQLPPGVAEAAAAAHAEKAKADEAGARDEVAKKLAAAGRESVERAYSERAKVGRCRLTPG